MTIVPFISRAVARRHFGIIALVPNLIVGLPAFGETYFYQDNFETDAVLSDSWRHSPVVDPLPWVHLEGVLHYDLGALGRGLGFFRGYDPGFDAYLAYAVIPAQMVTTGGSVSFFLQAGGYINVFGSSNGSTWSLVGGVYFPGPGWQFVSVPLSTGSPSQYLELRGSAMIDSLQISATYSAPVRGPVITQAQLTGAGFILRGSNATPYQEYVVLSTTNVALPQTQWTRAATNTSGPSGDFDCTNAVAPADRQGYFRLIMTAP